MSRFSYLLLSIIVTITILSINTEVLAAKKGGDIYGWNKAKWGMTKKDLMHLFNGATEIEKETSNFGNGLYSELKVPDLKIINIDFTPTFLMSPKDDKLHMLYLSSYDTAREDNYINIKNLAIIYLTNPIKRLL